MQPSSVPIPPLEEQPHNSSPPSIPPNLILWADDNETDSSYDSSQLQPSPSVMSVSISEEPDRSYETPAPFRRPSGSSIHKFSTLPVSPSMLTRRASLRRLVASPALQPSSSPAFQLSSSSSSTTSSAERISSYSSSFSGGLSSPSQPSLSPSSIVSLPLPAEPGINEESVVGRTPRTISTLLDTACASVRSASRSPIPIPIPPRTYTVPPEGRIITSVSTSYGSRGTQQATSSLRTVSEKPLPPTPRNFTFELDRLTQDARRYNDARGQENKEIVDNVKALRDELQGLSEYSRTTRPPNVVTIIERPIVPGPRPMESRSIGGSTEIAALHRSRAEEVHEPIGPALIRGSSITSSVESFLSSPHSDDLSLYGYHSASPVSPISDMESEFEDESSFASSSEVTESETSEVILATPAQIMPPILPIPPPEIMPTSSARRRSSQPTRAAPSTTVDWMVPINAIMDQLNNLAKNQAATVRKIDSFRAPEYTEIPEIHYKIDCVEELVGDLIQTLESRRPQPVVIPVPIHQPTLVLPEPRPPSQAATIHDQLP